MLLVPGLKQLQTNFSYRIWLHEDDPLLAEFDAFERRFGSDELIALLVHDEDGIFDEESVSLLHQLTEAFWKVEEVIRVDSLSNYNWTHAEGDELIVEPILPDEATSDHQLLKARRSIALGHEIIPGYLVSRDGNTAVIYAWLRPAIGGSPRF